MNLTSLGLGAWPALATAPNTSGRAAGSTAESLAYPALNDRREADDTYARLRSRHDEVNAIALAIRHGWARENLKLYPPYPPGYEARLAELERIPGLRKQIDALRYPLSEQSSSESVDELARLIGRTSRRQLAEIPHISRAVGISVSRGTLEQLALE